MMNFKTMALIVGLVQIGLPANAGNAMGGTDCCRPRRRRHCLTIKDSSN
jgi:hypothetical protein